jgi:hypothetical protein
MRIFVIVAAIFISTSALGYSCKEYVPPKGEKVELQVVDGHWEFAVPSTLEGRALEDIIVTLWGKDGSEVFSTSVAYKIEGNQAKGHFLLEWQHIGGWLQAYYGEEKCGPRLPIDINT